MSIFDKEIQPIISYGCVNWALLSSSKYIYLDNVPIDITNDRIINGLAASSSHRSVTKNCIFLVTVPGLTKNTILRSR